MTFCAAARILVNNSFGVSALIECIDCLWATLNRAGQKRRPVVFRSCGCPGLFDDPPACLTIGFDETPNNPVTAFGVRPDRNKGLVWVAINRPLVVW